MITKETIQHWKEDAKKATQGEWVWGYPYQVVGFCVEDHEKIMAGEIIVLDEWAQYAADSGISCEKRDKNHIANASPQNFLALIEAFEFLEERVDKLETKVADLYESVETWRAKYAEEAIKVERYEEALKFYVKNHFDAVILDVAKKALEEK